MARERTLVDDFLDALKDATVEFVSARFVDLPPIEPQTRRKNIKPPKVKTPKTPKAAKPRFEQTHYETLEVVRGASPETISAAYRSLCQRNHPDKYPNDARARKHGEERTKAFTEAYAVLKDPAKRKAYDAELKARDRR